MCGADLTSAMGLVSWMFQAIARSSVARIFPLLQVGPMGTTMWPEDSSQNLASWESALAREAPKWSRISLSLIGGGAIYVPN